MSPVVKFRVSLSKIYLCALLRSFCNSTASSSHVISLDNKVSSQKSPANEFVIVSGKLLIKSRKHNAATTVP